MALQPILPKCQALSNIIIKAVFPLFSQPCFQSFFSDTIQNWKLLLAQKSDIYARCNSHVVARPQLCHSPVFRSPVRYVTLRAATAVPQRLRCDWPPGPLAWQCVPCFLDLDPRPNGRHGANINYINYGLLNSKQNTPLVKSNSPQQPVPSPLPPFVIMVSFVSKAGVAPPF